MKAGAFFEAVVRLPVGGTAELTGWDPFVIIAPHPDDETLGCAGLMCLARACGLEFRVVVVTDGGASHPRSTLYPRGRLSAVRQQESLAAGACCGVPPAWYHFLALRDSEVPRAGALFDSTVTAVRATAQAIGAKSLFVTWRGDPHCDHEAVHDIAKRAAGRLGIHLWSYPIWGWGLPEDKTIEVTDVRGVRLDISTFAQAKRRAIACHVSQTTDLVADDPEGFRLTAEVVERFSGCFEYFLKDDP